MKICARAFGMNRLPKEVHLQQMSDLWNGMTVGRRMISVLVAALVFVGLFWMGRMASAPRLDLLYSGLDAASSGEIIAALEQQGVVYKVEAGSILVDSSRRDELRMRLASEGLPRNGSSGYELLDSMSGFGVTSQMFDVAYWRAKEGELARTISSSPQVDAARVHIAHAERRPFSETAAPTASIFVTAASGAITAAHAKAIRYLVAAAVAGLIPENVSIVDASGVLVGDSVQEAGPGDDQDRASEIRERILRLVEARVGRGNVIVEVAVDTDRERQSIRERRFDPDERVAISTDTEERTASSKNSSNGGDVTVASNLPDGAANGNDNSSSQNNETRERVNYEVSETEREIIRSPGAITRITVAALVNGQVAVGADGTETFERRSDEELAEFRELISAATGFSEERGDVITVKSMQFEALEPLGTSDDFAFPTPFNLDVQSLIKLAILGLVVLLLGIFVLRPVLLRRSPALEEKPFLSRAEPNTSNDVLTGEITDSDFELPELPVVSAFDDYDTLGESDEQSDPVARLRELISDRKQETVEIIRAWLEESEEMA